MEAIESRDFHAILVTGGAGFIGSNFVRYMLSKYPDYNIINLDKLTYAGNLENLKDVEDNPNYFLVKGDICDRELIDALFSGKHSIFKREASDYLEPVDCIVNFAAESHVDRSILGPEEFLRTNIMGTFTLVETARKYWGNDHNKLFLHISTDEVFGSLGVEGYFTEDTPYTPNSPYSASKAASDHLVRAYYHTYSLPTITTNCSNNYGPYQFPEKLIPLILLNALEGKKLPVYGDGKNVRDWLYIEDHCSAIDTVLHSGEFGETYNIGGNNEWKNIDIVNLICKILDELTPNKPYAAHSSLITFVKDRPGHDRRYAIDASKIKKELGWKPQYTFEKAIKKTIMWYLDNEEWCKGVMSGAYRDYYERQYGM